MTKIFTGNLSLDSLGIYQVLQKNYTKEDLALLNNAYKTAFLLGKCEENEIVRSASNHNPKPARILTLLYKEASIRDITILVQGISINPNSNDFNVKLAICLDELRHLHMKRDKTSNLDIIKSYSELIQVPIDNRLFVLTKATYLKLLNIYES